MHKRALHALASIIALTTATACGPAGSGTSAEEVRGEYTATTAGPITNVAFTDATHYTMRLAVCSDGAPSCTETGTYALGADDSTVTFTNEEGRTTKYPFHAMQGSDPEATTQATRILGGAPATAGGLVAADAGGAATDGGLTSGAGTLVTKTGVPLVTGFQMGQQAFTSFTVTYIGDSHSDYFGNARGAFGFLGQHVTELLTAQGTPLAFFAASGSSPVWWVDGTPAQAASWGYTQTGSSVKEATCHRGSKSGPCVPKLASILEVKPSLFVIEQGTNLLGLGASTITQEIQTMIQQVQGRAGQCLWVGAPNARTSVHSQASQDQLWQLIKQYASPACFVYDSRFLPEVDASGALVLDAQGNPVMDIPLPYEPDANNDGEHLDMNAAGKWATGVASVIALIESRAGK